MFPSEGIQWKPQIKHYKQLPNIVFFSHVQSNLYIKATHWHLKMWLFGAIAPLFYRLKLYALFINGENGFARYRQLFVI
jgi:hypothetical protein